MTFISLSTVIFTWTLFIHLLDNVGSFSIARSSSQSTILLMESRTDSSSSSRRRRSTQNPVNQQEEDEDEEFSSVSDAEASSLVFHIYNVVKNWEIGPNLRDGKV